MTGNATPANRINHFDRERVAITTSRKNFTVKTFIMAECDLIDALKSEDIIAKETKFLQEGCGCSRGTKGGQCCEQFLKEAVLSNLNNCLELSHGELDLVILANIQACTNSDLTGEKRKRNS